MSRSPQGKKSELKKVGDPNKNGIMSRTAYYCKISFKLKSKDMDVVMKVDTGASHTVIGLDYPGIDRYKVKIKQSDKIGKAYDASGSELNLYGYILDDFKITDDIVIPKILIYFSEELKDKAVLGMDILSLFDFQYMRDVHSSNGTFWFNNYTDVLNSISARMLNKNLKYVDPALILSIDDTESIVENNETNTDKKKYNMQDLEANYIHSLLKQ